MTSVSWSQPGGWSRHTIDDRLRGADGVKLADANGDGLVDLVVGWEESGQTRAYFHPGNSAVRRPWPTVTVGAAPSVEDALWVDLNADAQLDVLSCCEGQERSLRVHFAPDSSRRSDPEAWTTQVVPCSQGRSRWMFADIWRDTPGQPVVVAVGSKDPDGMIGLLLAQGPLEEWTFTKLADTSWVMSLAAVDVDGDGDQDLLYSDRKQAGSGVYWLENTGGGLQADSWQRHLIGAHGREVMFLDWRRSHWQKPSRSNKESVGHGLGELWVGIKDRQIYDLTAPRDPREPWLEEVIDVKPAEQIGRAKAVAVGDIDGDGRDELVLSCESAEPPKSGVVVLRRDGDQGVWQIYDVSGPEGIKFDLIQLVDLDGDQDLDILTCEERWQSGGLGVIWYANPTLVGDSSR